MNSYDFSDKVVLVTGGSRGIGKEIAKQFAAAQATVIIASRKKEALDAVVSEIVGLGGKAHAIVCHTGKVQEIEALYEQAINHAQRVDILINNAGTNPLFGPILEWSEDAWDKIFDVNLKGYFFLAKLVAPQMIDRKEGVIINVASIAGLQYSWGLGVYSITKAGILMLTKVMAAEWGPAGIRVNAIAPGVIDTRLSSMMVNTPAIRAKVLENCPLGRIGTPLDVASAALFLASDQAAYIHGHTLSIDGGTTGY